MALTQDQAKSSLSALVGPENVRTGDEERQRASSSWSPVTAKERQTGKQLSLPIAVVLPDSAEEVSRIVVWANETSTPLYPVGGASNTTSSTTPHSPSAVAVDLSRLQTVQWDEESLLVTAGAGCGLADMEEQLERHGYTLGHLPQSARLATVGGAVATNAIGLFSGRYGRQADLTSALEAVLPTGEIIRTRPSPGDPAYFNLHSLFVGTEGAFGIVTEVTMRMRPVPEVRAWAVFTFRNVSDAVDALRLTYRSDSRPASARLMNREAAAALDTRFNLSLPPSGCLLILGFEGDELVQTGSYQVAYAVCQQIGGSPCPPEVGDVWLEEQRLDTGWMAPNARPGSLVDVFAVSATWSQIKDVYDAMHRALSPLVSRLTCEMAHATSTGVALEIRFEAEASPPLPREALAIYDRIVEAGLSACREAGGSVTHHYGVGHTRKSSFALERGPEAMATLLAIKRALDPHSILAPL